MHKKIVVVLVTIVIFLSACVLGVSTVYRVDNVTLKVQGVSISDEAMAEEERLQKALSPIPEAAESLSAEQVSVCLLPQTR
jgi:peptidoglycan hydrolase CwlO-like protein